MHTHYENLKVVRNAPPAVIKAAYRALSQAYHPDRNKSVDAHRIMLILNDAWAVLGDADKRAAYDRELNEAASQAREEEARRHAEVEKATRQQQERDAEGAERQRRAEEAEAAFLRDRRVAEEADRQRQAYEREAPFLHQRADRYEADPMSPSAFLRSLGKELFTLFVAGALLVLLLLIAISG
jgi:DnaJ-class molecular chaperone